MPGFLEMPDFPTVCELIAEIISLEYTFCRNYQQNGYIPKKMKGFPALLALLATVFSPLFAQDDSPFRRMEIINVLQRPPVIRPDARSSQIKAIQSNGAFGTALTSDSIYITRDAGSTWER